MGAALIDADLSESSMVTAYEGDEVVHFGMAIRGVSGTPTPTGTFHILRRIQDETMDSETIGIPGDGPNEYLIAPAQLPQLEAARSSS